MGYIVVNWHMWSHSKMKKETGREDFCSGAPGQPSATSQVHAFSCNTSSRDKAESFDRLHNCRQAQFPAPNTQEN